MKRIYEPAQIAALLEKTGAQSHFDTPGLVFQAFCYEKGEYITSPGRQLDWLFFIAQGTVRIYGIHENGSLLPVDQLKNPALIGDLEYSENGRSFFFAEAATQVTCLALSVSTYRAQLEQDVRFLHTLLNSYAYKLKIFSAINITSLSIEERVLLYMQTACSQHELNGIESAVLQLRCSRRQLQRVLCKLCSENRIQKVGKGRYRLV